MPTLDTTSEKRYVGGIFALCGVVFIWVSSSFAMNSLFGEMNYNKPFLVTYLNTATFSFYLVPILFKRLWKQSRRIQLYDAPPPMSCIVDNEYTKLLVTTSTSNTSDHSLKTVTYSSTLIDSQEVKDTVKDKLSTLATIKLSLTFCILWFIANYTTNASLAYTSVGSSTILASMSGLFTLGIGALFKVERLTLIKIIAVTISLIGVSLVSFSDHDDKKNDTALIGDCLALLGAVFYGCYTTLLKKKIGNEDRIDMSLFFGFVGAFNVLLLWPMLYLLDYAGIESFEIPMNSTLWLVIILNAFIGTFVSDYLWLLSMLMTSPLVVTLGISLTIPLALIGDICFKGFVPSLNYAVGAILVIIGFLAVNTNAMKEAKDNNKQEA